MSRSCICSTRDWFAVCFWCIDTWQARPLALLLWAELSVNVTLQEENTPSFSSFLARGNERTWAFFWLDHCCWLRPGRAGSLLAAPGFGVDPARPLDCACWSRGCTELCAAGSAISAASLPLLGSPRSLPRWAAAIKFCDGFRYAFWPLHCACALQVHAGRCIIDRTTKLNVTLLSTGGH